MGKVLVANIGSTSFKFRLFDMPGEQLLAKGGAERIGASESPWKLEITGRAPVSGTTRFADYGAAIAHFESALKEGVIGSFRDLAAVGFKPVMAQGISGTQVLDDRVLAAMEALYTLFPAHNPPYVNAVRSFRQLYPELPCIGTFETAFYDRLPVESTRFPVPLDWQNRLGIRRYGFHGASHRYVTERLAEIKGRADLRLISCHLGGSSSICAVRHGYAVDSSWGMTPQSGLPQSNRVGDFDVFAALYLAKDLGLGLGEVEKQLSSNAGLKGMSGLPTGDVRDLVEAAAQGNENARTALAVFTNAIRGYIGRFLVTLNGADAIIFTAGIGENRTELRESVCANLDFCGLKLDAKLNAATHATETRISTPDSKIEVWVVPTNEEIVIARNAWAKLHGKL
ncbi:acetate/propionate family kinase [Opitutus sp. ER46]|uniref:acetate/propionate family kinase n=1 Tax=Opitutus sp. ER46 TaxID=2161864 RepID=UPI000D307777|nr:acetate/propionate family kinase [Opitutus sp. ER46]PTX97863.1 acetate/propionate family kinase [Opitutus sp. ER46]